MNIQAPIKEKGQGIVSLWKPGLVLGAALFLLLAIALPRGGMPVWGAVLWAAAFALVLPLRFRWRERLAQWLPRLAFAVAPPVAYTLVEIMNYNNPWTSFSAVQVVLNLVWYYMFAALVYLIVGRLTLSAGVAAGLCFLAGLANRYIIRFRGRTIFPGDFLTLRTAANVAGNYDYRLDSTQLMCLTAMAFFVLVLLKLPRRKGRRLPRLRVILPTAAACLLYLAVFFQTGFLSWLNMEPSLWTTRGNGFFLNFSICLRYSKVEKPEDYSQEALEAIASASVPAEAQGERPLNLIVIMNESFSDLSETLELETNQDPMPFIHALSENTIKGTAYASVFGGTTANSEYEFLTGNTMAFLPEGTVPYHMYVTAETPSLAGQLKDQGYASVAMHPYLRSGWNRVPVYTGFGFDKLLFQGDFTDPSYMRDYITDRCDFENVVRVYEEREEGKPLFIFNVTMQNHSAYNVAWKNLDRTTWLTGELKGRFSTVDQYLSLIRETDSAFAFLIDYFAQVEEPTMILMFGDHQPQVATNFYTEVLGGEFADLDAATQQKKQAVPFLLWANYDIPEAEGVELSLNYLSSLLMEAANLPRTGYQQFLSTLRGTVPAVNGVGYMDAGGNWYKRRSDMPQAAQDALNAYEMLQYNVIFDTKNLLPDFFTLPGGGETEETP